MIALLLGIALAASPEDVTGTLAGDPSLLRGGDKVFLTARPEGVTGGPPTWVRRIELDTLPMPFTLGPGDAMLGGATPAKLVLTARLDRDGDAGSKGPDDAVATSAAVAPGATGVTLTLEPVSVGDSSDGGAPPPRNAPPEGVVAGPDPASIVGPPAGPPLSGDALRDATQAAGKLLRCVVCQGLSVADSPSETAKAMRGQVEALVAKGYDTEQVLTWFEASYGAFVRLEPKQEGLNWLVWGAPVALLLLGAGVVLARTRGTPPAAPAEAGGATDDPWLARVRAETRPPGFEDGNGGAP